MKDLQKYFTMKMSCKLWQCFWLRFSPFLCWFFLYQIAPKTKSVKLLLWLLVPWSITTLAFQLQPDCRNRILQLFLLTTYSFILYGNLSITRFMQTTIVINSFQGFTINFFIPRNCHIAISKYCLGISLFVIQVTTTFC